MVIGSALVSNVCRIQRYLEAKIKLENEQKKAQKGQESSWEQPLVSFFTSLKVIFRVWMALVTLQPVGFGY
jgi:hypothetical protein